MITKKRPCGKAGSDVVMKASLRGLDKYNY